MTTIAWKDGLLAFDGLVNEGGVIVGRNAVKAIRTGDYLVALTGKFCSGQAFFRWVKTGMQGPAPEMKECCCITVDRKGVIRYYGETTQPARLGKLPIYAVGSGREFALGAMAAGKTAVEAVKIAARFDSSTGGKIRSISFEGAR